MNKVQQAIMASDLEYQKHIAHNNAMLLIRKDLQIKAVRQLHTEDFNYSTATPYCLNCKQSWPCTTIEALDVDTDTLERDDDHDSRRDWYRDEDLG